MIKYLVVGIVTILFYQYSFASVRITPVIQGPASESATSFAILRDDDKPLEYLVKDVVTGAVFFPFSIKTFRYKSENDVVDKISFPTLNFSNGQVLEIRHPDGELEVRNFKLLDTNKNKTRIVHTSCSNYMVFWRRDIWNHVMEQNPDLVLLGGDNVYAGFFRDADADLIWKRYVKTRQKIPFFNSIDLYPTLAIWDDHDYGKDGAGVEFPYKKETTEIFDAFYAQEMEIPDVFEKGPGISSLFKAFGLKLLMLDNRSFYEREGAEYYGDDQKAFISYALNESDDPAFLVNGTQFHGGYRYGESFEATHMHELEWLYGEIRESGSLSFFGSGDRHFTEIMELEEDLLGYMTYEFTSSSMHSVPRHATENNPRRVGLADTDNFLIYDIEKISDNHLKIIVTSIRHDGARIFKSMYEVKR